MENRKRGIGIPEESEDLVVDHDLAIIEDLCRKKFRREQPESSAQSVETDDSHILFFNAFLGYPITVDGEAFYPQTWAHAFLQPDLESTVKVLSSALITVEDLMERNKLVQEGKINVNDFGKSATIKRIAIIRVAKWMMNKNQNPWSYKPGPWLAPPEMKIANKVFRELNQVDCSGQNSTFQSQEEVTRTIELVSGMRMEPVLATETDNESGVESDMNYSPDGVDPLNALQIPAEDLGELRLGDGVDYDVDLANADEIKNELNLKYVKYPEVFKNYMEHYNIKRNIPINSADMTKRLTKKIISQNTDVFVDAVQFSKHRWAKAINCESIEEMAYLLFRKYKKVEYLDGKLCVEFDHLSAPRILAIIRAVAWIRKLKEGCFGDISSFDALIPEHNLFLSHEEIQRIRSFINHKLEMEILESVESADTVDMPAGPSRNNYVPPYHHEMPVAEEAVNNAVVVPIQPPIINGNISFRGQIFQNDKWMSILKNYKVSDPSEKTGKRLFDILFTDREELKMCSWGGRDGKQKFREDKVEALFEALAYVRSIAQGKEKLELLNSIEKEQVATKVFKEHAYLRRKRGFPAKLLVMAANFFNK